METWKGSIQRKMGSLVSRFKGLALQWPWIDFYIQEKKKVGKIGKAENSLGLIME